MSKDIFIDYILKHFPLRIAITDYCNLNCFFCSNEGMDLCQKNIRHIDIEKVKYLIEILAKRGLQKISFTGGDPTLYPNLAQLISHIGNYNFKEVFFHTNGILLNDDIIKLLNNSFNKVAISIHSTNFHKWREITNGTKIQYNEMISNLSKLADKKNNFLVEMKYVPIKGVNDSVSEIKDFLDLCSNKKFKFKFLNFEPIIESHMSLAIPFEKIVKKLEELGCKSLVNNNEFRGQNSYLPINKMKYGDTWGVVIEIGCGQEEVCKECYNSNEIFLTPGLAVRPCHMCDYEINLNKAIEQKKEEEIINLIIKSRQFLALLPGVGLKIWNQNK